MIGLLLSVWRGVVYIRFLGRFLLCYWVGKIGIGLWLRGVELNLRVVSMFIFGIEVWRIDFEGMS